MPRIICTRQANEDALGIWAYIAEHDPNAADQLILRINEMLQKLAVHPGLGSKHDKYRKGLRCFPMGTTSFFTNRSKMESRYSVFYTAPDSGKIC